MNGAFLNPSPCSADMLPRCSAGRTGEKKANVTMVDHPECPPISIPGPHYQSHSTDSDYLYSHEIKPGGAQSKASVSPCTWL